MYCEGGIPAEEVLSSEIGPGSVGEFEDVVADGERVVEFDGHCECAAGLLCAG